MAFDLDVFLGLPRVAGLALSPDGSRLVTTVATAAADGSSYRTALWELDPAGQRPPRRLTRSAAGESAPAFLPDGSLLFLSRRPGPPAAAGQEPAAEEVASVWLLPPGGGEARQLATLPAGVDGVTVARDSAAVVLTAGAYPGAVAPAEDKARAEARREAGVQALLFEGYPVRHWDHDLGPRQAHLYLCPTDAVDGGDESEPADLTDLTPAPGRALDETACALSPDGRVVVTGWQVDEGRGERHSALVAIDTASGVHRTLAAEPGASYDHPTISPDGRWLAATRYRQGQFDRAPDVTLRLVELASGEARDLAPGLDLWPSQLSWSPDSGTLYVTADERGHAPVFAVPREGGPVRRLTARGAYTDLCPAPDGSMLYALRSSYAQLPEAVALVPAVTDQEPLVLPTPGAPVELPGTLTEVTTTAADGTPLRAWLVLPPGATEQAPAPLLLWVHGGPVGSWNAWHWRWTPWVFADRGYAVLLPDPALSTGYGQDFIQRGWGEWGAAPYTDLMSCLNAALERSDLDTGRTAVMGGSFGGYMTNWVVGHTDRFRAAVTHASLWALDQFQGTTDMATVWEREFGSPYDGRPARYQRNSPHRHVGAVQTPMLVIHGERDFRVPIGEALRLYTDLVRHGVDVKYLLFPDEHHWIMKPGNQRVWYETVLAFLDAHVLGRPWHRPALL